MSETKSNKVEAPKKAAPKKVAPANDAQLFISPALSAIFWTISLLCNNHHVDSWTISLSRSPDDFFHSLLDNFFTRSPDDFYLDDL